MRIARLRQLQPRSIFNVYTILCWFFECTMIGYNMKLIKDAWHSIPLHDRCFLDGCKALQLLERESGSGSFRFGHIVSAMLRQPWLALVPDDGTLLLFIAQRAKRNVESTIGVDLETIEAALAYLTVLHTHFNL